MGLTFPYEKYFPKAAPPSMMQPPVQTIQTPTPPEVPFTTVPVPPTIGISILKTESNEFAPPLNFGYQFAIADQERRWWDTKLSFNADYGLIFRTVTPLSAKTNERHLFEVQWGSVYTADCNVEFNDRGTICEISIPGRDGPRHTDINEIYLRLSPNTVNTFMNISLRTYCGSSYPCAVWPAAFSIGKPFVQEPAIFSSAPATPIGSPPLLPSQATTVPPPPEPLGSDVPDQFPSSHKPPVIPKGLDIQRLPEGGFGPAKNF